MCTKMNVSVFIRLYSKNIMKIKMMMKNKSQKLGTIDPYTDIDTNISYIDR